MLGENALQNASTFKWICNFAVNFLICDMGLAKFHEELGCVKENITQYHSPLNSTLFQGKSSKQKS